MKSISFHPRAIWVCAFAAALCLISPARAQWLDSHWQFRRSIDVDWDADHPAGAQLAVVDIHTAGHDADGSDVRVAVQGGGIVASHVLNFGPGDVAHLVFALTPGQTHYYAYFGNPGAPPPPPGTEDVAYHCGLLLQMKECNGPRPRAADDVAALWENSGPIIRQTFVAQPFYTDDPFGQVPHRIYKISGSLMASDTRDYFLAGSAEGFATLYLDGRLALSIPGTTKETRFSAYVPLTIGRHDFVMYYWRPNPNEILALDWRRPDTNKLEPIPRSVFGIVGRGHAGPLEQDGKPFIADFDLESEGECQLDDNNYSHRYLFSARVPPGLTAEQEAALKFDWDFGDGTTAGGKGLEHVYISQGIFPVKLTVHTDSASDTQTTCLSVDREWGEFPPPADTMLRQGRIVAHYDLGQVPEPWLSWMVLLERDAQLTDAEMAAAARLISLNQHAHPDLCLASLRQIAQDLIAVNQPAEAANMWDHVSANSDLQPAAAADEVDELIWRLADFPRALKAAQRVADSPDPAGPLAYAQALVLNGRAADAEKVLADLQQKQEKAGVRLAAISGAMARTVEFRVDQKDWETGEADWHTWLTRCPLSFMEGYSVVLRTDMLEDRGAGEAAAKIDEAYAQALPNSPYAPQLLDRAASLMAKIDPAKSKSLRDLLKTRYPEDPLGQK
jgi:PKD repeat protein